MEGLCILSEILTVSGKRSGADQPDAVRTTRQRLLAYRGGSPKRTGTWRRETYTSMRPPGESAGCRSDDGPENGATTGLDQPAPLRCDSRIIAASGDAP